MLYLLSMSFWFLNPFTFVLISTDGRHQHTMFQIILISLVMVVRYIRRALVEYHDILWDIGYAENYEDVLKHKANLYQERPPLEDFVKWRDEGVLDGIQWYG